MPLMKREDIVRLGELSRIAITEAEIDALAEEIPAVLSYVGTIDEITSDAAVTKRPGALVNVMRTDEVTTPAGKYKEALLASAPETEGEFVKVKKILHHD